MNQGEPNYKKALFLKIFIIVIAAFILFLWLANLRNVLQDDRSSNNQVWQKITEDIDSSLDHLNKISDEMASTSASNEEFVEKLINLASSSSPIQSGTSTIKLELKEELSDLIKNATTTVKNNCPPYINCMPTIGEARPCVVPVGCEDVTQIAY